MSAVTDFYGSGVNLNGGQFGAYRTPTRRHRGQDISHSSKPGTVAVPALHAGRVISKTVPGPTHGFGYSIVIRSVLDGMEFDFRYAHGPWASQQAIGEEIPQGKIILHEGNSGATSGSCVHIEQQRVGGGFLDPLGEIRSVAAGRLTAPAPKPAPTPAPAPAPAAVRSVRKGDKGALVSAVQARLKRDYPLYASRLVVDGEFGSKTDAAVREFQRRAGLTVDGIAGPKTLARLGL
ncbi:peptidoglycan-binding protein [Microbacterium allomyrinae]|uniref:Peptidoglycan-binding protein n=1 Tax=Microbacterium allomyrinae TaxID=2830666 RepID=A0A9X1LRN6_9MICO|nr:peptidoglycan-binding protein [Microbacterium allomyrinae]MCC2030631.1 peptidoglycan-binding protein [Microbacterium allomyrinae]